MLRSVALIFASLMVAPPGFAGTIIVSFEGTVTRTRVLGDILGSDVSVGDAFSGSFEFESQLLVSNGIDTAWGGGPVLVSWEIRGIRDEVFLINMGVQNGTLGSDRFFMFGEEATTLPDVSYESLSVSLHLPRGTYSEEDFGEPLVPTPTWPQLASADGGNLFFHLANLDTGADWEFGGTITHVSVIPEPGTAALLAVGLIGLVVARRRSRG